MNLAVAKIRLAEMLLGIGMAAVIIAIIWIAREFRQPPEIARVQTNTLSATLLETPLTVPEFKLVDQHGNSFTGDRFKGRWSFVFFGYTNCPDVCPTTLSVLVQMEKQLQQFKDLEKPAYVFISIDPDRDTPEHLAQYMTYFHQDFLGVTGSLEQLQQMTKPLGIFYEKNNRENESDYSMSHSSAILLIDTEGRLRALTSPPHDATAMVSDYRYIVAQ